MIFVVPNKINAGFQTITPHYLILPEKHASESRYPYLSQGVIDESKHF
jgi:hypothetical protein